MYFSEKDEKQINGPLPYSGFLNSSQNDGGGLPHMGWNYPADMQHLVHPHWRGFPIPEIYYNAFFFIGYFILMLISLFGNGLVIWIFSTSKNLRTPSNLLIINLAVFDLVMCTNMPQYLMNAVVGYIVGSDMGCDIYAVCGGISGMGASMSNAFIAFDRYRTISNPIDGRLNFVQISFMIVFTWMYTIPFSVLPFFRIWGRYMAEGYLTTCSFDYLTDTTEIRFFVRSIFTWAYCIPMTIIVTSYTKLFFHVRRHEQMLADQAKKMNVKSLSANADAANMNVEMRIAKAAMTIYLLFVLSWTPYACVALLGSFGQRELITPFVSMLPGTTAKVVSCLDPWVYAASHPKYRLELERRLPWLGVREKNASNVSAKDSSASAAESSTIASENC